MAPRSTTSVTAPRGILAHGFLRLRCGDCGHDQLVAFSCKRLEFFPSYGAPRCLLAGIMFAACNKLGELTRIAMHV